MGRYFSYCDLKLSESGVWCVADAVNRRILRAVNRKLAETPTHDTATKGGKRKSSKFNFDGGKAMEKDAKDGAENFIRTSLLHSAKKHMRLLNPERLMRAKRRTQQKS